MLSYTFNRQRPLPAVNQIQWFPGMQAPGGKPFAPYPYNETFEALRAWCDEHGVLVNGYSPFGGNGEQASTLPPPSFLTVNTPHTTCTHARAQRTIL